MDLCTNMASLAPDDFKHTQLALATSNDSLHSQTKTHGCVLITFTLSMGKTTQQPYLSAWPLQQECLGMPRAQNRRTKASLFPLTVPGKGCKFTSFAEKTSTSSCCSLHQLHTYTCYNQHSLLSCKRTQNQQLGHGQRCLPQSERPPGHGGPQQCSPLHDHGENNSFS